MSFTYGSFGDIITTVQLAARLLEAVNGARGSAREFQELVVEVRLFHRALDQLMLDWPSRAQCPKLDTLAEIITPEVRDCQVVITSFLDRAISRYGRSLRRPTGSKTTFKDITKMIQWNLFEIEPVAELRGKLCRSRNIITMVYQNAQAILQEQNHLIVSERLASIMEAEEQTVANIDQRLDDLAEKLEEQAEVTSQIHNRVGLVLSTLDSVNEGIIDIQRGIANLNPFAQRPVMIEDALGWEFPVPLEIIRTWHTLDSIMADRFSDRPGSDMIRTRRYDLQDATTGKKISRRMPLNLATRPGQKLNMLMVYYFNSNNLIEDTRVCPRCNTMVSMTRPRGQLRCENPGCEDHKGSVVDVTDMNNEELDAWMATESSHERYYTEDEPEDEEDLIEDAVSDKLLNRKSVMDSPEVFKRVRFLSRWEKCADSREGRIFSAGDVHFWDMSDRGWSGMARYQMGKSLLDYLVHSHALRDASLWSSYRSSDPEHNIFITPAFVGRTREESRPIILLYSNLKGPRRRALKLAKELAWLAPNSPILVASTLSPVFEFTDFTKGEYQCAQQKPIQLHPLKQPAGV